MASSLPSESSLSKLKELNLFSKKWMNDSVCGNLALMLAENTSLTFVGFRECRQLGDKGAAAIAQALEKNSTIKKLNFESTNVHDNGAAHLARAISSPQCSLVRLDLSYCSIGDKGASSLARALGNSSSALSILMLEHCIDITNLSGKLLADSLEVNGSLKTLGLKGTSVSADLRSKIEKMLSPMALMKRKSLSCSLEQRKDTVPSGMSTDREPRREESQLNFPSKTKFKNVSSNGKESLDWMKAQPGAVEGRPSIKKTMSSREPTDTFDRVRRGVPRQKQTLSSLKGRLRARQATM
mmetsp:Transcript_21202/g.25066  ORF Transcript_21202/g.25066 Transcript_21202/m.25066 type:complete len:297 (+) Transcript_21202:131-1021(+)|eukprot:CAMPEP_0114353408 /NCGR_PEP_ID=MMETSP0101-20121206/18647_1 /TAXON_ID=38822 ORGANISM="Pteridomonas danica, Strain PT" /NCGR_SAMPLE_ID=MMETSP0101 /ASSEMBLY_ACC=CAM_ASM_000211 /LENGTH=296 /DNA_ID=CAMNT_0001494241 /DNA_START=89 /DNA_END=979 /DNA_ORIENTATION=+